MATIRGWALLAVLALALPASAGEDLLVADFEGETYGDWKITGEAFGAGPARGTLPGQMPVGGFLGKGLVNSFRGGDRSTGTLTSPPVRIERPYVVFLIGGGGHAGKTCMNLLLDGQVVRTAAGPNTQPGGSEQLDWHTWDVKDLVGKTVSFQIVDDHTGGWGHVNVDHILQSERPRRAGPASRDIAVDQPYLHLPVKTGAPRRRMKLSVDGAVVREFDIELADDPGFFVFADVGPWKGKKLTVAVDKLPEGSRALERVATADKVPGAAELYRERHRPQFHFTSRRGWLNDPNGLVYFRGEWHLFYQHNPYGWDWGNMHWGHAVSKDLVHWQELPIALYPRRYDDWAFSGSALVVENRLAAAFTSTGRGECLAHSDDRGRTWQEFAGNPVVKHAGRDPKVIRHGPSGRWVMAVYDEHEGKRWIAFYSSADLKRWDFESRIEGFFECPDLFELPVAGADGLRQWVLYAADGKYVLGQFDGKRFNAEPGRHQLWFGNFYAAQTYSDAPDGRRVQIGWGQGITFPGMPFNQQMTVPCELTLRKTPDGVRMFAEPVKELDVLRGARHSWGGELKPGQNPLEDVRGELFDVRAEFSPAETITLTVRGVPVTYDARKQELSCRHVRAPLPLEGGKVRLRVLVDRGSIEVFGNGGRVALSVGGILPDENRTLALSGVGRASVEVYELASAWR